MNMKSQGNNQNTLGNGRFQVNPTLWGYVLISKQAKGAPNSFVMKARKILGAFFLAAIVGLWLTPNAVFWGEILAMKLLLSALYLTLGAMFLFSSGHKLSRELQVDLKRGEVLVGFRNQNGAFNLEGVHAFGDINMVALLASQADTDQASLLLHLKGGDIAILAGQGERALLEPCRVRLAKDILEFSSRIPTSRPKAGRFSNPLLSGPRAEHAAAPA